MRRIFSFTMVILLVFLIFPVAAFADDGPVNGEEVTDLAAWSTITGALQPFLIGIILQQQWSRRTMSIVSAAICALDGIVVTYFEHGLHLDQHVLVSVMLVYVTAQTTYKRLWQPALNVGAGKGLSPIGPPPVP